MLKPTLQLLLAIAASALLIGLTSYRVSNAQVVTSASNEIGAKQCAAVIDYCGDNPECLAPVSFRPVNCDDPACNDGPCKESNQSKKIKITSITPAAGQMGTAVTLTGRGFSKKSDRISGGNTINWGFGQATNVFSEDGKTLQFTASHIHNPIPCPLPVPGILEDLMSVTGVVWEPSWCGVNHVIPPDQSYQVTVTNAQGDTSNTVTFTLLPLTPLTCQEGEVVVCAACIPGGICVCGCISLPGSLPGGVL